MGVTYEDVFLDVVSAAVEHKCAIACLNWGSAVVGTPVMNGDVASRFKPDYGACYPVRRHIVGV